MTGHYIWTIGCQMNKADSRRLASLLEERGYAALDRPEDADIIIVNSCVVRQHAEDRVVNKLDALRLVKKARPGVTIAVTGCLVNGDNARLRERFPYVDYFFKAGEIPEDLIKSAAAIPLPQQPGITAYVPIIQGCDNFCSYCIVPYRRGREKSRPAGEIEDEVRELVRRGVREVTLLGQNVDSYGHDLPDKPDLADLLARLDPLDGLARLRFLTNHPKDMSARLIDAMARLDKVCEQVNLPVQSGDNDILKAMRREYTAEHYLHLVERIRARVPGIALSTDIIVGFPVESDAQYKNTVDLLAAVRFDAVHVAAYSPRAGTIAARDLPDDVPADVKKTRLRRVEELQGQIGGEINRRLLDRTVEVLVEGRQKGRWQGRTRTDKLVFFDSTDDELGKLVRVKINKTSPWSLQGQAE